jgi:hypothetical protein
MFTGEIIRSFLSDQKDFPSAYPAGCDALAGAEAMDDGQEAPLIHWRSEPAG